MKKKGPNQQAHYILVSDSAWGGVSCVQTSNFLYI